MSRTKPFNEVATGKRTFVQNAITRAKNRDNSLEEVFAYVYSQESWHEFRNFNQNADFHPGPDADSLLDYAINDPGEPTQVNHQAYLARLRDLLVDATASCQTLVNSSLCIAGGSTASAV